MDRQEAIEILTEYKKWELDCNHCKSDLHTAIYYSSALVAKAIDTLIAPILITDEMVERAKNNLIKSRWSNDHLINGDGFQVMVNCYYSSLYNLDEDDDFQQTKDYNNFLNDVLEKTVKAALGGDNATN
jgi:hypothetical protein